MKDYKYRGCGMINIKYCTCAKEKIINKGICLEALKNWLKLNKDKAADHNSWFGDTENGFQTVDLYDEDKLMQAIDEFAAEFRKERR